MKVKFEVKATEKSTNPVFTIFLEHKGEDMVEFLINRFNMRQLALPNKNLAIEKTDIPITDGILQMNKQSLKKFIAVLQLLLKN